MKSTQESVTYTPAVFGGPHASAWLPVFNGPLDGHPAIHRTATDFRRGEILLWYDDDGQIRREETGHCEMYELAMRWKPGQSYGLVLVWVAAP